MVITLFTYPQMQYQPSEQAIDQQYRAIDRQYTDAESHGQGFAPAVSPAERSRHAAREAYRMRSLEKFVADYGAEFPEQGAYWLLEWWTKVQML